jgi:hypothetical protein
MPELDPPAGSGTSTADTEHTRQIARLDAAEARLMASIHRDTPATASQPDDPTGSRRRWWRR